MKETSSGHTDGLACRLERVKPRTGFPGRTLLFGVLLASASTAMAPEAHALWWLSPKVSAGLSIVPPFSSEYGTGDGHSASAEFSLGIHADGTLDFFDCLTLGVRALYLDIQPASGNHALLFPGVFAGLKTPALDFLPELYARVGIGVGDIEVGESDYYGVDDRVLLFGSAGVRYMLPRDTPLADWGFFAGIDLYTYIVGEVVTVSFGAVKSF